jgi:hypothetical protein
MRRRRLGDAAMKKGYGICLVLFCVLLCVDCAKKRAGVAENYEAAAGLASTSELMTFLIAPPSPPMDKIAGRFIAVTHRFAVEVPEAGLAKAWASVIKSCDSLECEVLASSITSKTASSPPKGTLSLRITPKNLDRFMDYLNKSAAVIEHTTESADKTTEVVDTDAKLKNKTEFRDRLRGMLAKSPAGVKELIEVERELANVQAEIDSLSTTQKSLQNETRKVAVQITFISKPSLTRTGALAPIANAWDESGYVLAESLGSLITFIVAMIPWLVLIIPAIWIIIRLLRRRSRKAKALALKEPAIIQ